MESSGKVKLCAATAKKVGGAACVLSVPLSTNATLWCALKDRCAGAPAAPDAASHKHAAETLLALTAMIACQRRLTETPIAISKLRIDKLGGSVGDGCLNLAFDTQPSFSFVKRGCVGVIRTLQSITWLQYTAVCRASGVKAVREEFVAASEKLDAGIREGMRISVVGRMPVKQDALDDMRAVFETLAAKSDGKTKVGACTTVVSEPSATALKVTDPFARTLLRTYLQTNNVPVAATGDLLVPQLDDKVWATAAGRLADEAKIAVFVKRASSASLDDQIAALSGYLVAHNGGSAGQVCGALHKSDPFASVEKAMLAALGSPKKADKDTSDASKAGSKGKK